MAKKIIRQDYPAQVKDEQWVDHYPDFILRIEPEQSAKIVIITNDIVAPFEQDSALNLYFSLLNKNISSSLLILKKDAATVKRLQKFIVEKGLPAIDSVYIPELEKVLRSPISDRFSLSYQVNLWLIANAQDADVFIFVDCNIDAYFTLLARKSGVAHQDIRCVLYSSSTKYFEIIKSSIAVSDPSLLNVFYCEREALVLADVYTSNSQHYLNWMNYNEFDGNAINSYYHEIPNFLSKNNHNINPKINLGKWFFVFGRSDTYEVLFCLNALNRLGQSALNSVFLFPFGMLPDVKRELKTQIKKNGLIVEIKTFSDSQKVIQDIENINFIIPSKESIPSAMFSYLSDSKRVVLSNDFYVLSNELKPVLLCFNNNPEIIKGYLNLLLSELPITRFNIKSSVDFEDAWASLLYKQSVIKKSPSKLNDENGGEITVTVCISHYNRGEMLLQAINSILAQTYKINELVIVDDGSNDIAALSVLDDIERTLKGVSVNILRQSNLFIGASRNAGLNVAKSEYILFMDDDNLAMPNEVDSFVASALCTDADITTCLSTVFSGDSPTSSAMRMQTALFLGPNISAGLICNPYGDSNMFAKVQALKSIGGFSQHYRVGRDDQEMLSRACLSGLNVNLLPIPLYYYRLNTVRIRSSHINPYAGFSRVMQAYSQSTSNATATQLMYLQGLSYFAGPWGISSDAARLRLKLIDILRVYVAKYPRLYDCLLRIKSFF